MVALAAIVMSPTIAAAHPLGNFTTNTYAGIIVSPNDVHIDYVLDLAEVPAFQVTQTMEEGGDGIPTDAAARAYASEQCLALANGLELTIDGRPAPLRVDGSSVTFPPGSAGLSTLRLECDLAADLAHLVDEDPVDDSRTVTLRDSNFPDRLGWREITARGNRTTVVDSDVPAETVSDRLRSYPDDRAQSPLQQRTALLTVERGGAPTAVDVLPIPEGAAAAVERVASSLTSLMAVQQLTASFVVTAIGLAMLLGAVHSLAPGHGKTVMAAFLIGQAGATRQALGLGVTVAVAHTAGVLALGLALSVSQTVAPERAYPWLGLLSGLLFAAVGIGLLYRAIRSRHHPGHHHARHHHHDQLHGHEHADVVRAPGWRALIIPGLAGGMVPSPSALVVLLGGFAVGRAWFGVTLVVAYGIGMALTLVGAGFLLVRARDRLVARQRRESRWTRLAQGLPITTSALIVVGGLLISLRFSLTI